MRFNIYDNILWEIIILLFSALFILNWWAHGYWKRRNVYSLPTEFIFGNIREIIMNPKVMGIIFRNFYEKYKQHKMVGFYCFYKPMLFVRDPEIIKRILATDFNCFSNNGFTVDKNIDPFIGYNPFTAKTIPLWKELRSIQATNLTALKLKEVVPGIVKIGEFMNEFIKNKKNQPISVFDITTRAAIDSAILFGFGIEPKSFTDSEFSFMKYGTVEHLFSTNYMNTISSFFLPSLSKIFNSRITSKAAEDFFISMTKTNIEHRKTTKITRGDLFDTILKLNKKKLEQGDKAYSNLEMSAHCATFYLDATVTSATVSTFLLLELATHQDIQEKLRREIFLVGKKPEDFDFDKINGIPYLQMVFDESIRIHSPVTVLTRSCTKDTVIEDVKISKGTKVFISSLALHYDPEYYPEPEKFDPERFSENNKESMTKYTFLPFGEGPRICVGLKYGNLFVKTLIAFILLKYRILPTYDQNKVLHDYENFLLVPKSDATIKFEEL
ncbi:unnamed protein product [Nezara viridula]|uniref:Cytochrome P450 n=1 Tax=Nezara viridula TaxID=85310 RepID=A0A9P0MNL2_NEZVI|nr:unnamed protein product [Nezara viridula]